MKALTVLSMFVLLLLNFHGLLAQDPLSMSFQKNDVSTIGLGNAYTANGYGFNGMLYNPALLGRSKDKVEILNLSLFVGSSVKDAILKVVDNRAELKKAPKTFQDGIKAFDAGGSAAIVSAKQLRAIQKMDKLTATIGKLNNTIQKDPIGVGLFPGIMASKSFGDNHFGFAAYGNANIAMKIQSGSIIDSLLELRGAEGLGPSNAAQIESILNNAQDENGDLTSAALPSAAEFGIVDITFVGGYARTVNKNLTVGANVKYVMRRSAVGFISAENLGTPLQEIKKDIKKSNSKIAIDVGATYALNNDKTTLGIVIQDAIGTEKDLKSSDPYSIKNDVVELPLVRNIRIGGYHKINEKADVMMDVDDLADQTGLYDKFIDRMRIGGEYRYPVLKWLLLPVRAGFGQGGIAIGTGLHFGQYFHIDYAYAKEHSIETFYQHNLQLKFMFGI